MFKWCDVCDGEGDDMVKTKHYFNSMIEMISKSSNIIVVVVY